MKVKESKRIRDDLKLRDEVTGRKSKFPLNKTKLTDEEMDDYMLDE